MGTRSLLAVEKIPDKIYVQYMQFDGYPSIKGYDYYNSIFEVLQEDYNYFITNEKPNQKFFKRIINFLNDYQYKSSHSIGAHHIISKTQWNDNYERWNYLFDNQGNFIIQPSPYEGFCCTIPWDMTLNMAKSFSKGDTNFSEVFPTFWKEADNWDSTVDPILKIEVGQTHVFPEQDIHGWRTYGLLITHDKSIGSLFSTYNKNKRHVEYYEILFKSEYLIVKNTPQKDLPLLIGNTFKSNIAKELLSERLKS